VLLGNVLRHNRIRQEKEEIYSNKVTRARASNRSRMEYKRLLSKRTKGENGQQKEKQVVYMFYRFEPKLIHLQPLGHSSHVQ
jgi:hypothetical protein